jgi:hypothetical protein
MLSFSQESVVVEVNISIVTNVRPETAIIIPNKAKKNAGI